MKLNPRQCKQESDSSNSSPLSSSNTSSSPVVTTSPPPPPLDNSNRTPTANTTDEIHRPNGNCITNGLRNYHTKVPIHEVNGNEIDDSSYMALDQLLASLALENDIMERHLSQINNNDTNGIKSKHSNHTTGIFSFDTNGREHYGSNGNYNRNPKPNTFDENLNDVLANLIEFSENETPQYQNNANSHVNGSYGNGLMTNGNGNGNATNNHQHHHHHLPHFNHFNNNFNNNNHINSNYVTTNGIGNSINNNHITRAHNYHEPSNNAIKRLTSESENSSSVSPSLSERSNGIVSWSDQVCHQKRFTFSIFVYSFVFVRFDSF